ncbi:hypothetical protein Q9Q99_02090 [Curtobacterium flaccumfaciens]|nr:hypothetical protein Q9Q99_02090 [Curtobacterium flaccumfaciens]
MLVGAGDAMTFISVIRLVPMWFSGRILPQISQWTGNLGQIGQVLSAFPFAVLLHSVGWTPAFGVAAAASAVGLVLAAVFVRNGPVPVRTDTIPLPHSWGCRVQHLRARAPAPRHTARVLVALRHAVLGHGVLPAVGRPDAPGTRVLPGRGGGLPHDHRGGRVRRRPGARRALRTVPDAPVEPGARRGRAARGALDGDPALARAPADLAARAARRRDGHRRTRVCSSASTSPGP